MIWGRLLLYPATPNTHEENDKMTRLKAPLAAALVGCAGLALSALPVATSAQTPAAANAAPTVPVDVWALRNVVNNVQVSPDGKHILVHKVESKEGDYLIEIYKTNDLSKPYRRLNADPMEIFSVGWVSDTHVFGNAWKVVRKSVKRPEQDIREYKALFYDLEANEFSEVDGNFGLVSTLPNDPDHILISAGNAVPDPTGVDPFVALRPRAYYKVNLKTGSRSLVLKGSENFRSASFDGEGNPFVSQRIDPGSNLAQMFFRLPGEGSWGKPASPFVYDLDEHENLYRFLSGFIGSAVRDVDNPSRAYIIWQADGEDKAALWEYDIAADRLVRKVFEAPDADVIGIQTHSIPGNNRITAVWYPGAKMERQWFDAEEKALHEALEQSIPNAHLIQIASRSRDGNTMIVRNVGPRDPGSFWLVKDGQMAKLGSRNPLLDPEQLSDVEYIRYPARDGRIIPAYVTKPKGEGPFPLIVLPHGGPHVNEVIMYDEWGQMLANNGYMVLQPQYRISTGWGKDHFDAGYGQHGLAMQDDKDDGALYLIEKGWADPDRIAMFGWSYGGQAALYALSRTPQLYQCAIAGAAVADAEKQYLGRRSPNAPVALDDWSKRRGTIGINPINEVDKVNIPLLMIHPDDDRRVMYYHFEDYKKAFEKAGKTGQFVTVEGADHFSTTHMYRHQLQIYTKILDFLANDCGPGGL